MGKLVCPWCSLKATALQLDFDPPATACILCGAAIRHWNRKQAHGHTFNYDRCSRCGFVFVNPRPTFRSLGHFYENYLSLIGGATPSPSPKPPAPTEDQRRSLRRILRLRPGPGRFLDVGSGVGQAAAAAWELGLTVTALEIEPHLIKTIQTLPGVSVIRALFEDYQPPSETFDYVLMSHVLEHTHDPQSFIFKGAKILAAGGLLWILVPNFDSIYRRILGTGDPYFTPPTHLNHFNPACLADLCRRAGLQIVQSNDYHDLPRDVLAKRTRSPLLKYAATAAAVVAHPTVRLLTDLSGTGAFVSCCARKPAP